MFDVLLASETHRERRSWMTVMHILTYVMLIVSLMRLVPIHQPRVPPPVVVKPHVIVKPR